MSPLVARRIAWALIGVMLGLALVLALPQPPVAPTNGDATRDTQAQDLLASAGSDAAETAPTLLAATLLATRVVNVATLALELSADLHALAATLLPRAEAGDTEAQYALALIARECAFELKRYADRAELDAFLETVPRRSGIDPVHYAALQRERFESCDGFRADPLDGYGSADDWLARAGAAGQPLAALELEMHPSPQGAMRDEFALREAARAALASGRPEAFLLLLELEFPDEDGPEARDATPNAVAWWLLACARGYPCGPEARWRREQLAFRGGQRAELGWDDALLFDLPAHEREQARARAAELGDALDAGDLDRLLPLQVR